MIVTPQDLQDFIDAYRRVMGKEPKLRECVEHFDGRVLNVLMALWELRGKPRSETNDLENNPLRT
jgi:hypothetical protein